MATQKRDSSSFPSRGVQANGRGFVAAPKKPSSSAAARSANLNARTQIVPKVSKAPARPPKATQPRPSASQTSVFSGVSSKKPPQSDARAGSRVQTKTFTQVKTKTKTPPAQRIQPKQADFREHTSLNWRSVKESGAGDGYRSPRFQGAAREYVKKSEPHMPSKARPASKSAPSAQAPMNHLKAQSPKARRERSKHTRRQTLETLRRQNYRHKFRVVSKKKKPKSFYLKIIGATLALYLLFLGGYSAFFRNNLMTKSLQQQGSVRYTVGVKDTKGYLRTDVKYGTLFRGGIMYLNMNHIAALCDLTTTGDLTQMRFTSRGSRGDSALFRIGSRTAVINGTPVTLAGPAILENDTVYVAADFFSRFSGGLTVDWNEEKSTLAVTREVVSTSVMSGDSYAELTFGLDKNLPDTAIDFELLDIDLQMKIEANKEQTESSSSNED